MSADIARPKLCSNCGCQGDLDSRSSELGALKGFCMAFPLHMAKTVDGVSHSREVHLLRASDIRETVTLQGRPCLSIWKCIRSHIPRRI